MKRAKSCFACMTAMLIVVLGCLPLGLFLFWLIFSVYPIVVIPLIFWAWVYGTCFYVLADFFYYNRKGGENG